MNVEVLCAVVCTLHLILSGFSRWLDAAECVIAHSPVDRRRPVLRLVASDKDRTRGRRVECVCCGGCDGDGGGGVASFSNRRSQCDQKIKELLGNAAIQSVVNGDWSPEDILPRNR